MSLNRSFAAAAAAAATVAAAVAAAVAAVAAADHAPAQNSLRAFDMSVVGFQSQTNSVTKRIYLRRSGSSGSVVTSCRCCTSDCFALNPTRMPRMSALHVVPRQRKPFIPGKIENNVADWRGDGEVVLLWCFSFRFRGKEED